MKYKSTTYLILCFYILSLVLVLCYTFFNFNFYVPVLIFLFSYICGDVIIVVAMPQI